MYLKPDDVEINEPPIIVNNIKNNDKSIFGEKVDIPDVESDEVIANKTLENSSCWNTKNKRTKLKKLLTCLYEDPLADS